MRKISTHLYHGDVVVGEVQTHDVGEDRIRVASIHPQSLKVKSFNKRVGRVDLAQART